MGCGREGHPHWVQTGGERPGVQNPATSRLAGGQTYRISASARVCGRPGSQHKGLQEAMSGRARVASGQVLVAVRGSIDMKWMPFASVVELSEVQ